MCEKAKRRSNVVQMHIMYLQFTRITTSRRENRMNDHKIPFRSLSLSHEFIISWVFYVLWVSIECVCERESNKNYH